MFGRLELDFTHTVLKTLDQIAYHITIIIKGIRKQGLEKYIRTVRMLYVL